jgi:hypothetical protein
MATVPQTIVGKIEFFEQHLPTWSVDPVAIGLNALEVADLATMTAQARADYETAQTSRVTAKGNTEIQNTTVGAMANFGGDLIKTIRAFAEKTDDSSVYAAAGIPAPQPPTPAGPPEQPTALAAALLPGGGLRLTWKGTLSQSAFFSVYRKVEGETNFTLLFAPAAKSYDDTTIPAGVSNVTYFIEARRDDFTVPSGWYQVNFGAGGATVTSVSMAA